MKLDLAPIQGMTTAIYRNSHASIFGGIDAYYAPFIATTDERKASMALFKDLLPECNKDDILVIPQLLGNSGPDFRHYASIITDLGYGEINWNIGCPFPAVTRKNKGSGLLDQPEVIRRFLEDVCGSLSYRLSVKMRLGMDDLEEGFKVISLLNDYPLESVIIHARTGVQKYDGSVNLDGFDTLKRACRHSLSYNGDIYSYADYLTIQSRFPDINRFMLGRGALRDPFLPVSIKSGGSKKLKSKDPLQAFHDSIFEHYMAHFPSENQVLDRMKEFWSYTSVPIDPDRTFLEMIKRSRSKEDYMTLVTDMLEAFDRRHR